MIRSFLMGIALATVGSVVAAQALDESCYPHLELTTDQTIQLERDLREAASPISRIAAFNDLVSVDDSSIVSHAINLGMASDMPAPVQDAALKALVMTARAATITPLSVEEIEGGAYAVPPLDSYTDQDKKMIAEKQTITLRFYSRMCSDNCVGLHSASRNGCGQGISLFYRDRSVVVDFPRRGSGRFELQSDGTLVGMATIWRDVNSRETTTVPARIFFN